MTDLNENHNFQGKLPEPEYNRKLTIFSGIIVGLIIYILCCFSIEKIPTSIYIFYNIIMGITIGGAISYGINKDRYINKKIFFVLIVLSSSCTFLLYSTINSYLGNHKPYLYIGNELLCGTVK